jgi:hypothetical protein
MTGLSQSIPSPTEIREELERMVLLDLLGPVAGPEEEIAEPSARDRYLVGMLALTQHELSPEFFYHEALRKLLRAVIPRQTRQFGQDRSPAALAPRTPTLIDELDTDEVMAAFRQASRGRGWMERNELLKHVSLVLGYQRLGPRITESLHNHLRAAIRRRIIETDGPNLVHPGTATMADYELEDLRESFRSVMRKGTRYEREDVIHALARYLGFVRVTDTICEPIKSAINSAIRRGLLGYEGTSIWREGNEES